jgi:hypothetical protein
LFLEPAVFRRIGFRRGAKNVRRWRGFLIPLADPPEHENKIMPMDAYWRRLAISHQPIEEYINTTINVVIE